jgi:hypothetical protein
MAGAGPEPGRTRHVAMPDLLHSFGGDPTVRLSLSILPVLALAGTLSVAAHAQQPATPGLTPAAGNPNLAVATVKLENGTRASKVIGASVYVDGSADKIGSVDDLIITEGDKVTVAIISVGGVMGVGGKLVALPYTQLRREPDKVVLTGATKDSLNAMPSFTY